MIKSTMTIGSLSLAAALLAGCGGSNQRLDESGASAATISAVSAPIAVADADAAYAAALDVSLPETAPTDHPGLHNVYRLGDRVISGSEPEGEEAFVALAEMGVKTILSVDGKAPEVERAAKHGIRYVHVPIRYRGVTEREFARISATFLEAEAPFYVHCFHGKHRGPAAAAIGRIALDGLDRRTALAEMRQWCGTAGKYAGLYHSIATRPVPGDSKATVASWGMPGRVALGGYREAMIDVVRASDALKMFQARDWKAHPGHPDLDPTNEADKLAGLLERSAKVKRVAANADLAQRNDVAAKNARRLHELLRTRKQGGDVSLEALAGAMKAVNTDCKSCHTHYRNR